MPPTSAAGSGGKTGLAEAEIHSLAALTTRIVFFPALGADPRKASSCVDMASPELYELHHQQIFCSLPRSLQISCSELHCE